MIYVMTHKYPLSEFLFCGHSEIAPLLLPIEKRSFFARVIKKIQFFLGCFLKIDVFSNFFPAEIYEKLQSLKKEDSLIFVGESFRMYYILSRLCPNVKKIAFFWNSCSTIKDCDSCIKKIKNYGFSIATFDSEDAKKYNLIFAPQFYKKITKNSQCNEMKNDFFFCGKNKGRKKLLLVLKETLSSIGSCNFVIPEKKDAMHYLDYIEELKKSRVLCDVNQENQSGLTLRVLESLFFSKKLITNNIFLDKYDFYNPNNILIYSNRTTEDDIYAFLMKPYEPVNDEILARYEVTNVLKNIAHAFEH